MPNPICTVDGCNRSARTGRAIYCRLHYLRWWRHGDPTYETQTYTQCTIAGCTRPPRSHISPLCETHYYRAYRHGDPLTVINTRRDTATYRAAHERIAHDRGKASGYPCVDCGDRAQHWSYDHADADELMSPGGQPYSLDSSHYEPRCAQCHALFDGVGANQYSVGRMQHARD